jgi:hypothetical protein
MNICIFRRNVYDLEPWETSKIENLWLDVAGTRTLTAASGTKRRAVIIIQFLLISLQTSQPKGQLQCEHKNTYKQNAKSHIYNNTNFRRRH